MEAGGEFEENKFPNCTQSTSPHQDITLWPGLHSSLLLTAQGRQACHLDMWNCTASTLQLLWTVCVQGNQAGSALQHRQVSQPSLPAWPRQEWNTAKERTRFKGWAWEQMQKKKKRKRKNKNKEILSWFVCFSIYTTVNKFRGLLVYNAFCGHVIQMRALI